MGVASLSALAMDHSLVIEDTLKNWEVTQSYEPQWSADQADEYMSKWRTVVQASLELDHA